MNQYVVLVVAFVLFALVCFTNAEEQSNKNLIIISTFLNKAKDQDAITTQQYELLLNLAKEDTILLSIEDVVMDDNKPSVFTRMYNHLTLLNVLYFSGSLLIMGAYSLLMTLAYEHYTGMGLANIIALQAAAFGITGVLLWNTQYQFLGGLLVSICTSMVPYTVYCYQRAIGYWDGNDPGSFMDFRIYVRSGWINMEIAAISVGFLFLFLTPFPFLLAPVSFALWFLSMDIAPLFRDFNSSNAYNIRRNVSVVFGIGLIILGRFMEWELGSDPDFGFWLYLFGLITFWFSIVLHPVTNDIMAQTVFFLINVSLVLVGSQLDRVTFHIFGTVGVALTVASYFQRDRIRTSFILWLLKALAAIALFSNAIKTDGTIEIINGVICFIIFNIEGLMFIHRGELYNLLILVTNLGFVLCIDAFNRPLNLWFFQLPNASIVMSFVSLSVCLYHVKILHYYQNRFNLNGKDVNFLTYRFIVCMLITLVFIFSRQYWWAWCGVIGIPLIAMLTQPYNRQDGATVVTMISQFILLLVSISIAVFIDSNIFYLVSNMCMCATVMIYTTKDDYRSNVACCFSILLIFFAIPLQSKFMIAIGGIYIFTYLSHLAYTAFKNSFMFPLVLVGLGLTLICIGVVYQGYEEILYTFSTSVIPVHYLHSFHQYIFSIDWYSMYIKNARFSNILQNPFIWIMWPGPMVHSLSIEPVQYAGWLCGIAIGLIMIAMSYLKTISEYCPDLTGHVMVTKLSIGLDRNSGSGILIELEGSKPAELSQPRFVSLGLNGDSFWKSMSQVFGTIAVKVLRSAFLPYQLTPSLITFTGFKKDSKRFTAIIEIGTGKQGKPSFSHQAIINNCRKVHNNHTPLTCELLYSNAMYLPYVPLCHYSTDVNRFCNEILGDD